MRGIAMNQPALERMRLKVLGFFDRLQGVAGSDPTCASFRLRSLDGSGPRLPVLRG